MPVYLIAALVILVLFSVIYFFMFYQKHMLGDNAPELKLDIRVWTSNLFRSQTRSNMKMKRNTGFTLNHWQAAKPGNSRLAFTTTMPSSRVIPEALPTGVTNSCTLPKPASSQVKPTGQKPGHTDWLISPNCYYGTSRAVYRYRASKALAPIAIPPAISVHPKIITVQGRNRDRKL